MSRLVGASEQGRLQGANASIMGIANLFGPALVYPDLRVRHRRRRHDVLPARRFSWLRC